MMRRTAIHPGEHLAEELQVLGISAAALGRQLKVPTNRVTEILNGQRAVTGDTALRLAHFGPPFLAAVNIAAGRKALVSPVLPVGSTRGTEGAEAGLKPRIGATDDEVARDFIG